MNVFRTMCMALMSLGFGLTALPALALSDKDYLPDTVNYDPAIPLPESVLGAPVGEWHVRHDQLVAYMKLLAEKSDRVSVVETGRTHENRPLLLLAFTSEENQRQLKDIQRAHLDRVVNGKAADTDAPLVLWMGYSVHGNEPSGSNASMLIAYYLAAGQGEEVDALLNNNVVLLDPSINPDGLSRFAQWANMHRGKTLVSDPNHREHDEGWPSGRTNHYWFDLNRDWLLLTHPESRARISQFHQWRPHVLTDFHEMGTNSTYFFQPGIASRKNPWTPNENVVLTEALADFHAKALDQDKQLYFTQESFDDFYYGKGSTYPDVHGAVGILFEQASSRGHLQDSVNGPLSFPRTIQNQVTTSLSTFAGALANRDALRNLPRKFYQQTQSLIKDDDANGMLVRGDGDQTRFERFQSILAQHQIKFQALSRNIEVNDKVFSAESSLYIPYDQPQYRLIKSLFSERTRFNDNTFYDVSNWNIGLAFDFDYAEVEKNLRRDLMDVAARPVVKNQLDTASGYAYAFAWNDYAAPRLLQSLLDAGVAIRVAEDPFAAETGQGRVSFEPGTIVIPTALKQPDDLAAVLTRQADALNIRVWTITSGLTSQGIDLGSRKMHPLTAPKVLVVGGRGTSQYEVGELWHFLDQHIGLAASIVELDRLGGTNLDDYTHMIWVDGRYSKVEDATADKVHKWLKAGGVLIGQTAATEWFSDKEWLKVEFLESKEIADAFDKNGLKYGDREAFFGKQRIAGAAFDTLVDTSHPLAFGLQDTQLPMFKNDTRVMLKSEKPFVNVALYTGSPLRAGYTSDELEALIANSAAVAAHSVGSGKIIGFVDNLNFRGYWYGTSRLMSNAIYMAGLFDAKG